MKQQLLLLASSLLGTTSAWWNNGHMLTARIAYDYLQENNPEVLAAAEKKLQPMTYLNEHEQNHTFVEAATFADDIKIKGMNDQSPWHFIDQPFFDNFTKKVDPEKFNVTWSIDYMHKNLKGPRDGEKEGVSWTLGDGLNLRFLIHYVGDMHQPLHTVSRFAKDFPDGDLGGNLFMLTEKDNITELHALWDSCVYEFDQDFSQPLNESTWEKMGTISKMLRGENPADDATIAKMIKLPESEWASEGYKIATTFVYDL